MSQIFGSLLRASVATLILAVLATAGLAATPSGASATSAPAAPLPNRVLRLTFNDAVFTSTPKFVNGGTAGFAISLASGSDGFVKAARGRVSPTTNVSVRMPGFNPAADGPRAVIRVQDMSGPDNLNPGTGRFTFGADFVRDVRSEQAKSHDNGDNLIQRGLFGNRSQYKIQLDHGRARCRVKGVAGVVDVTSTVPIKSGRWYRARCSRAGGAVSLSISRWSATGRVATTTTIGRGATGNLTPSLASVPLSIGGKLHADGKIVVGTDQFNGRIDNAVLQLG